MRATRSHLPPAPISSSGSTTRLILKIFPPLLRAQFVSERAALSALRGRLGIPIPEIVVEGERDGWPYLVITRLAGVLGSEAWPSTAGGAEGARACADRRDYRARCSACRRRLARHRAALGRVHARTDRRLPGASRAARAGPQISRWPRRSAARCGRADPDGCAAGDPDRRIHSGKSSCSTGERRLAPCRADRFRRRDDRMARIRSARSERLHGCRDRPRRVRSLFEGFGYSRADVNFA